MLRQEREQSSPTTHDSLSPGRALGRSSLSPGRSAWSPGRSYAESSPAAAGQPVFSARLDDMLQRQFQHSVHEVGPLLRCSCQGEDNTLSGVRVKLIPCLVARIAACTSLSVRLPAQQTSLLTSQSAFIVQSAHMELTPAVYGCNPLHPCACRAWATALRPPRSQLPTCRTAGMPAASRAAAPPSIPMVQRWCPAAHPPVAQALKEPVQVGGAEAAAAVQWGVMEVCHWLEAIGFETLRKRFMHHLVDGPTLLGLSDAQLKVSMVW